VAARRGSAAQPEWLVHLAPAANFWPVTFTYKVNDGFSDSNTATVTINVTLLRIRHP
jgi:hypothetical protein